MIPAGIQVKSILNKTKRRDPWFLDDYTINPYSGCSFNCLYCYTRGSKYGEHLEMKTSVKTNALEVLEKQLSLRAKKNQHGIIVLSSSTDPYLHLEEETNLTRSILERILYYRFPVHIITKSALVTRDFDLLHAIEKNAILPADLEAVLSRKTFITFSFSTTEDTIAKIFEPGAALPSLRLEALQKALDEGFHAGVSLMPLLPFITDNKHQLENMFSLFSGMKIKYIFPATLTLFGQEKADNKTLVMRAVEKHYPHLVEKYESFFRQSSQMPAYYQQAFYKKMQEISKQYALKNHL